MGGVEGKVVVVTEAAGGIGSAIAKAMTEASGQVGVWDLDEGNPPRKFLPVSAMTR